MNWSKLEDLKPGDKLKADGGFTCLKEGDIREVKLHECGSLYVDCADGGKHFLEGQLDYKTDSGEVIGFELVKP